MSGGVIAVAAQKLGIARRTLYSWITEDTDLQEALREIRDEVLDLAEGQLLNAIREGSERSIHFYLRTVGRERGYGDKVDATLTAPGGGPVQVETREAVDFTGLDQDERDALRSILERRLAQPGGGATGSAGA